MSIVCVRAKEAPIFMSLLQISNQEEREGIPGKPRTSNLVGSTLLLYKCIIVKQYYVTTNNAGFKRGTHFCWATGRLLEFSGPISGIFGDFPDISRTLPNPGSSFLIVTQHPEELRTNEGDRQIQRIELV